MRVDQTQEMEEKDKIISLNKIKIKYQGAQKKIVLTTNIKIMKENGNHQENTNKEEDKSIREKVVSKTTGKENPTSSPN